MTEQLFSPEELPRETDQYTEATDYVSQLVGEGKKYKDANALAYSRMKADEHIATLEREREEQRRDLEKRLTYEELLTKIKDSSSREDPANQSLENIKEKDDVLKKVEEILDQKLNLFEKKSTAKQNVEYVRAELKKVWGDNYPQKLQERARELEVEQSLLESLAENNPKAFLKIVSPTPAELVTGMAPPRSSVNISGDRKPFKTMSEYRELLKTPAGRRQYQSPETQHEIARLAAKYGSDFINS